MKLVIVTGMSGAGKTIALKMMEDMGFYCVDNLPILLLDQFRELSEKAKNVHSIALGIDIRSGDALSHLEKVLNTWDQRKILYDILFLEATTEMLIKRYKESRRAHPLAGLERLDKGIEKERTRLKFLKQRADFIVDTSQLLTKELKHELESIFIQQNSYGNLFVTVLSFGFKHGIPMDADLVFDVRFLPNPYYVEALRHKTGEDDEVQAYVKQGDTARQFLNKLYDMIEFLVPNYVQEGKNQLVIAVGCTGGKHRSVTITNELYEQLKKYPELGLKKEHRDIKK